MVKYSGMNSSRPMYTHKSPNHILYKALYCKRPNL